MDSKCGYVSDAVEVILEPDLAPPVKVGNAFMVVVKRLEPIVTHLIYCSKSNIYIKCIKLFLQDASSSSITSIYIRSFMQLLERCLQY
mgnify:FL=1